VRTEPCDLSDPEAVDALSVVFWSFLGRWTCW